MLTDNLQTYGNAYQNGFEAAAMGWDIEDNPYTKVKTVRINGINIEELISSWCQGFNDYYEEKENRTVENS